MMFKSRRHTQVSYRQGRPIAAYVYLKGWPGHKSVRTEEIDSGLVIDFSPSNEPLGLEIINPATVSIESINETLRKFGERPLDPGEVEALKPRERAAKNSSQDVSYSSERAVQAFERAETLVSDILEADRVFSAYGRACQEAQAFQRLMSELLVMVRLVQRKHLKKSELVEIQRDLSEETALLLADYLTTHSVMSREAEEVFKSAFYSRDHLVHQLHVDSTTGDAATELYEYLEELIDLLRKASHEGRKAKMGLEVRLGYSRDELENRLQDYVKEEAERYE